ncbi:Ornithine decarboxylase antizyme [Zootermopsis nevadensis]|uniref:Ornithine decarboxylase antizyme n=1 Tax=Zootermopsis nevadensis TaxID=136037 RepID=A0A067R3B1_ZOONE|nr:Ornithine decarboxylase antizyme [Zootermopsis nevadensis]
MLEYAEEVLKCTDVIVCFKKDCNDRALIVRTFMYMGFTTLPPGHQLIPGNTDTGIMYMLCSIE